MAELILFVFVILVGTAFYVALLTISFTLANPHFVWDFERVCYKVLAFCLASISTIAYAYYIYITIID